MSTAFLLTVIILMVSRAMEAKFDCTTLDARTAKPSTVEQDGVVTELFTIEFPGLQVGDSVCFLKHVEKDGLNLTLRYVLTVDSVKQTYSYSARNVEYTFGTPFLEPICTCQCPTKPGEPAECTSNDKCNGATDCIEWKGSTENLKGCFYETLDLTPFAGMSRICCKIFLSTNETFTSYTINDEAPKTAAQVTTAVYLHDTGEIITDSTDSLTFSSENQGSSMIDRLGVSMKVTIDVQDQPVLGQSYYNKEDESTVLVAEKAINSKESREVDKFGWLRVENGDISLNDRAKYNFGQSFSATATDCAGSELNTMFTGTHSFTKIQTLASKFSTQMTSAERSKSGKVVILPHQATVELTITQSNSGALIVFTDVVSQVTNFTALLVTDKNSNRFLQLTFTDTSGFLRGDLTAGNESETFRLFVGEEVSTGIQPVVVECVENKTRLCLETMWSTSGMNSAACNPVQCKTAALENPEDTNTTIKYTKGEKDSILNPLSWLKYANPKEWFNGIDSAAEGFIVAVVVILSLIVLSVLVCVVRCCCTIYNCCTCCGVCFKHRRRKRNEGREMLEETHL